MNYPLVETYRDLLRVLAIVVVWARIKKLPTPDGHPIAPDGHPIAPDGHPMAPDGHPMDT